MSSINYTPFPLFYSSGDAPAYDGIKFIFVTEIPEKIWFFFFGGPKYNPRILLVLNAPTDEALSL